MVKFWEGKEIDDEIICFSTNADGTETGGNLIYAPVQVLRLCSWDGQTDYIEGRDYTVSGRHIHRTPDSRIPFLSRESYCKPYTGQPEKAWLRLPGGQAYFEIFPEIYKWQCQVSYFHDERWTGFIPRDESSRLPRSMKLLKSGAEFNLVFYGDSITAGWEASGCDEHAVNLACEELHLVLNRPPYQPSWAQVVTKALIQHYPSAKIHKFNRSAGAATISWGRDHAAQLVGPCAPDLVVLAFGMNSLQDAPERFRSEIEKIITRIRFEKPECEFLLVSPMTPCEEIADLRHNKLAQQEAELSALCELLPGTALAPVNALFREIAERGKTYMDITGNCINHPNDFSVRAYAQTIQAVLGM